MLYICFGMQSRPVVEHFPGDEKFIDEVLSLDEQRRKNLSEVEQLKAQRNKVSKEIGALMGQKKIEEAEAKKKETRDIGEKITALDKQVAEIEDAYRSGDDPR